MLCDHRCEHFLFASRRDTPLPAAPLSLQSLSLYVSFLVSFIFLFYVAVLCSLSIVDRFSLYAAASIIPRCLYSPRQRLLQASSLSQKEIDCINIKCYTLIVSVCVGKRSFRPPWGMGGEYQRLVGLPWSQIVRPGRRWVIKRRAAEGVRPVSTACRRYAVDCERRRRSHCGKPHVQPRRGLTWGKVSPQTRTSERFCCGRISGVHCLYYDRASPKLDGYLSSSVPTLSISDAERGVYHDRRVSDAPIIIVSSTR